MTNPLKLLLVDEDPVFRLGLRIWLEQTGQFEVVGEASDGAEALDQLAQLAAPAAWSEADDNTAGESGPPQVDLVVLDLGLGQGDPQQLPGLRLCAEIKSRYPALPVMVLSAGGEPVLRAAAEHMGADGFGLRGMPVQDLARKLQSLIYGTPVTVETSPPPPKLNPLTRWRYGLRQDAISQIEQVMEEILTEQRRGRINPWNDALLAGRYRELRAARWLVNRLLATPSLEAPQQPPPEPPEPPEPGPPPRVEPRSPRGALTLTDQASLQRGDVQALVFEAVFRRLQGSLANNSDLPLEIDILREDRRRELLYLTLRQLEDTLGDLRQAQVRPGQLAERAPQVLRDVWEAVTTDFFGRYYTLPVITPETDNLEQPMVKVLLQEETTVSAQVLDTIPLLPQLFGHLLYRESLPVDGNAYIATTPEALNRSRELLEHLIIQLANGVMVPVLNRFGDVEQIKKNLYSRRVMSTRDIERFRNDLSWRYRWDNLINTPKAIFESKYRLLGITERGIQPHYIYAPRREELEQLSRVQLSVTLAIEARDAIAPRFRNAIAFVGSGIVYVLTDLVGRGIGLIGRGILKGIGNAWNDSSFRQDRK